MGNTDSDRAQDLLLRSKISPHLLAVIADWTRRRSAGETVESTTVPLIKVLVELKEANTAELEAAGIDFSHLFGLFYSAQIPLDRLTEIALLESVLRVHEEKQTKPSLDDSIPEIRATNVRNSQAPFSGTDKFTGLGVIVGIIDNGINALHPVFRLPNDQTKTRIRALLDQTQSPAVTFTRAQIEAAIATDTQVVPPGAMVGGNRVETDANDHKHGTHVAGIAAGNGKKAGNCSGEFKYVGVAPEAELVIVKHDFGGTASLQAAIQFIASTAAAIPASGVPCVINMSLSHPFGPHDGTDPMDQMIDSFIQTQATTAGVQPVVLVSTAGNKGAEGQHSTGSIAPGGVVKTVRFELNAEKSVTGQATSRVNIRFNAPQGLGCRLIPPGNNTSGGSNLAPPDGGANFTETDQNSTCSINASVGSGGNRTIDISVQSTATGKNQPGEWTIELTNAGAAAVTYHAWIDGDQWDKLLDDVSRANTVRSPGSATSMICVGNYHSSGKDKGKISDTSSRGPRLDGAQKPDISAPGEDICSAKRDLHTGCCCDCCCDSYIDMSGTSMAAPHVTGAIALMLERNPLLTHQQIKTVMMNRARKDSFTGTTANNDFGAGKLDVIESLNDPLVRGSGTVISSAVVAPARVAPRIDPSAVAPEWAHAIPQLEAGTPLWRLLNTTEGRRLYERGRTHWEEVRAIVNTQKRVATVWHRNYGPMLMHHATRTALLPHVPLPREIDGVELSIRAAKLVTALEPYSSKELIRALHQTLPLIACLQGKTLLELIEFFEASEEMQHA